MKKLNFVVLFLTGFIFCSSAQSGYQIRETLDFYRSNKMASGEWNPQLTEKDIAGSPYLTNDFQKGTVYTTSKYQYNGLPLRYNAYNDQMEFKTNENEIQSIAAPETVEKIEFDNYKMVYIPYTNAKKIRKGFFIVMEEGNASLYKKPEVVFERAEEPKPYQEAKPARFVERPDSYYIKAGSEVARSIETKKDLTEVFPDHQKEVEKFIKKNKVKLNKPDRLLELVQFYNSL